MNGMNLQAIMPLVAAQMQQSGRLPGLPAQPVPVTQPIPTPGAAPAAVPAPDAAGGMPTLGQPAAADPMSNWSEMASAQSDLLRGQRQQEMADALTQSGYVPNSGVLGVLAEVAKAWAGSRANRKADEKISSAMERLFKAQNVEEQRKAERALQLELSKEQRSNEFKLNLEREKESIRAKRKPEAIQILETLSERPDLAALDASRKAASASRVNVSSGPQYTAFQKAMGTKQAEQFVGWQEDAIAASEIKQKLGALREITAAQQTGKVEEAKALITQWFGSEAGANMQAFNAAVGPMIVDAAQKLKPLSEGDIITVKKMMPNFGHDPRANATIMQLLDSAADRQIDLYDRAATQVESKGTLEGFRPTFSPREESKSAPAAGKYAVGQVITSGGKRYRVTGGDMNDPDVEEVP